MGADMLGYRDPQWEQFVDDCIAFVKNVEAGQVKDAQKGAAKLLMKHADTGYARTRAEQKQNEIKYAHEKRKRELAEYDALGQKLRKKR